MKSHISRRGRLQIGGSLLSAALLLGMFAVRSSAQGGQDNPPVVSNAVVTPSSLPYTGGEVSIAADVVDDFGVTSVYADVLGRDNSPTSVQLFSLGGDRYGATYGIPPNLTDEPVS